MTPPQIPNPLDGHGKLKREGIQILILLALGNTKEEAARQHECSPSKIGRWHRGIEWAFGRPILTVMVQLLNEHAFDVRKFSHTYDDDVAARYEAARDALRSNPLGPAERRFLIENFRRYPKSTENWTILSCPKIMLDILGDAGIDLDTLENLSGMYALILAIAAEFGEIMAADLPNTLTVHTVQVIGDFTVTVEGRPGATFRQLVETTLPSLLTNEDDLHLQTPLAQEARGNISAGLDPIDHSTQRWFR